MIRYVPTLVLLIWLPGCSPRAPATIEPKEPVAMTDFQLAGDVVDKILKHHGKNLKPSQIPERMVQAGKLKIGRN